jgi:hypothetical protein
MADQPDPILRLIEAHQIADQRFSQLADTLGADEAGCQAAADAEFAAFWRMFERAPTTLRGFAELFAYLGQQRERGNCLLSHAVDYWSERPDDDGDYPDEGTWMRMLADAMERMRLPSE